MKQLWETDHMTTRSPSSKASFQSSRRPLLQSLPDVSLETLIRGGLFTHEGTGG